MDYRQMKSGLPVVLQLKNSIDHMCLVVRSTLLMQPCRTTQTPKMGATSSSWSVPWILDFAFISSTLSHECGTLARYLLNSMLFLMTNKINGWTTEYHTPLLMPEEMRALFT
jgi:hypothetical protein